MTRVRLRRRQVVSWVVAIALVALATAGLRLSESGANADAQIVTGSVGQPVRVNHGEITVTQVRVGTAIKSYDTVEKSPSMFVVVRVVSRATGSQGLSFSSSQLLSGDRTYANFGIVSGVDADPGFSETADLVFEVDPTRIDDLTLELSSLEFVSGYQQHLRIHLGITAANSAGWRAAAQDQVLDTADTTTEAIG